MSLSGQCQDMRTRIQRRRVGQCSLNLQGFAQSGNKFREEYLGSLWEEVVPQEGWTGLRIDR